MKKTVLCAAFALAAIGGLAACQKDTSKTISVCASELPHAKILEECISPLLKADGYTLEVKTLDWSIQNDAVANGEYDANYFQHVPYLKTYTGSTPLYAACKVHYEKLCLYAKDTTKKTVTNGSKIEIVNDVSNIERALKLLEANAILTINASNYDTKKTFTFPTDAPNSGVTWSSGYENCKLTCVKEAQLCASIADYDFGVIPGNTALTGFGTDLASRIVFGENPTAETISGKANIIAVKKENKDSIKTKELVKVFQDASVSAYITKTFGESVLYHFENGLTTDFLAD
jgi:D-methionine transport system substrate-binding protein